MPKIKFTKWAARPRLVWCTTGAWDTLNLFCMGNLFGLWICHNLLNTYVLCTQPYHFSPGVPVNRVLEHMKVMFAAVFTVPEIIVI